MRKLFMVIGLSLFASSALAIFKDVEFKKNKIYEFQSYTLKNKFKVKKKIKEFIDLDNEILEKFKAEETLRFKIRRVHKGMLNHSLLRIVEWDSLDEYNKYINNTDVFENTKIRDGFVKHFISTHTKIENDTMFRFNSEKTYEIAGIFIRPDGGQDRLGTYFKDALPLILKNNGKPIFRLIPFQANWDSFLPQVLAFGEWDSLEALDAFESEKDFVNRLLEIRTSAFSRLEQTFNQVIINN